MTRKIIEYRFDELKKVSHEIGEMLLKSKVLLLYGDLGSGKTTFTKSIVENLGGDPQN